MDSIFHEKQDGALCAQHCLNNLLQGEYFTPVDLSSIAQQLDEEERMRMAEGGMASDEYRIFLRQPSGNMDDSGFFSIQVISSALGKVWGLEQVLFNSPEYRRQMIEPTNEKAFICNYKEHWFTVRRLGQQWFNLNSLLTGPELISDTYLALFLAQLQQEGYSIFVILGNLPECEADQVLGMVRVQQQQRPRLIGEVSRSSGLQGRPLAQPSWTAGMGLEDGDSDELRRALALSRRDVEVEDEDADLRQAIQLSMQGGGSGGGGAVTSKRSLESNVGNVKTSSRDAAAAASDGGGISEGTQSELARSEPPAEELRRRRQAYFDRRPNQQQAEDGSTGSSGSGSQGRASDGEESPARNKP